MLRRSTKNSSHPADSWSLESWRFRQSVQQPTYADQAEYERVLSRIRALPPLVFPGEMETLKGHIAEAGEGKRFILQGGDCVERFIDCNAAAITNKLKILLQMSVILTHAARRPVVRIGRIAGQFFKPRSQATEEIDGLSVPSYRGDAINDYRPNPKLREPDPARLLQSYYLSALTINYIRAMINGGFADLHHPYTWNLNEIERSEKWQDYRQIVEQILDAIHFMESFGGINQEKLGRIEYFTSHEGLHLAYEEALTREDAISKHYYNLGAHMLWIGDRTRKLSGAHIEYFRGIANPIGVKIGPTVRVDELLELVRILNPGNEPGKITLITRLGAERVAAMLPALIRALQETGKKVTWSCDPMHGNTTVTRNKVKTRSFQATLPSSSGPFRFIITKAAIWRGSISS